MSDRERYLKIRDQLLMQDERVDELEDENQRLKKALSYFLQRQEGKPGCWEYGREKAEAMAQGAGE